MMKDVIDFLEENIPKEYELNLSKIISKMNMEILNKNISKNDFVYENTAIALVELYFTINSKRKFNYENKGKNSLKNIRAFTADKKSLEYLLRLLNNIKEEVSNEERIYGIKKIILRKNHKNK